MNLGLIWKFSINKYVCLFVRLQVGEEPLDNKLLFFWHFYKQNILTLVLKHVGLVFSSLG